MHLYVLRNKINDERERDKSESEWHRWRVICTMFANANRDGKLKPTAFEFTDFVKLSFDEVTTKDIPEDAFEQLTKKWGKKLNGQQ